MEPNRPMLMIEGPRFSGFDFSPFSSRVSASNSADDVSPLLWMPTVARTVEGKEPFVINRRRIVLPDRKRGQGSHGRSDGAEQQRSDSDMGDDVDDDEVNLSHTARTASSVWDCGAGQGIVSLSAAALGADRVVVTDIDSAVPALMDAVQLNGFSAPQVQITALDWTDRKEALGHIWSDLLVAPATETISASSQSELENQHATIDTSRRQPYIGRKLDYILASDVIWVDYLIPALVETMNDLLQATKERRDSVLDEDEEKYRQWQHGQGQHGQGQHGQGQMALDNAPIESTSSSSSFSTPVVLLAYQFRSTRSDQILFDSFDRLGLSRRKLRLNGPANESECGSEDDGDTVFLDPKFLQPNLAIWKIWKE
ncbi:hypothetical protein BGZ98_003653 [Dissophora globulifera]|nr:hypothetical protein BGZ98_003653 [Dissophora globulifera]